MKNKFLRSVEFEASVLPLDHEGLTIDNKKTPRLIRKYLESIFLQRHPTMRPSWSSGKTLAANAWFQIMGSSFEIMGS